MNFLTASGIYKKHERNEVVKDVSFTQQQFQKIAIAGETGSGKSTLLKIIGGLVQADAGEVRFEGVRVKGPLERLLPGHPGIAYLSQHFELRNHYRVEEELDYTNKLPEEEAATIYDICDISHLLKRWTSQLSGGEKQRIALARLLISSPKLLLLDEPFSNLDMVHKTILKKVIRDIGERLKITCTLISHDPLDTLSWADEIIVMKDGKILQKGTPQHIYKQPVNEYVAGLFGSYNVIPPSLLQSQLQLLDKQEKGKNIIVRPEDFKIAKDATGELKGTVTSISFFGSYYEIDVQLTAFSIKVKTEKNNLSEGDIVSISLAADAGSFF